VEILRIDGLPDEGGAFRREKVIGLADGLAQDPAPRIIARSTTVSRAPSKRQRTHGRRRARRRAARVERGQHGRGSAVRPPRPPERPPARCPPSFSGDGLAP
jgi:hypothetical protein